VARITIVVPTYNRARTLGRAIDSVLGQDPTDIGCLVVDDGSTDSTPDVLARYEGDRRVAVIRCPSNRGVTGAKNVGLDHLPPDCWYFGILDSDDALVPGAITKLVRAHEERGRFSQVFGWCEDPATGEHTGTFGPNQLLTYEEAICGKMKGEFWQLVRRDMLGDTRFEPRAAGGESSLWWRLLKNAPGFIIPDVVRLYDRSGSDRVSRLRFDVKACEGRMWAYRAQLDATGEDLRAICPRRYAEQLLEEAKWAALAGLRKESLRALKASLVTHPSLRGLAVASAAVLVPPAVLRRAYERRYAEVARRDSWTGPRSRSP
jgi:glycosyltransferase involved in cell wall biosynthesis